MGDFLNFLNTAELELLTKTPGITRVIAGNIISARPFDSVDECLNVHGMGKNLLSRLQAGFETGEKEMENKAMIQIEEEAPTPIERSQFGQESTKSQDPFFSRLGKALLVFIRALFRLIAVVAVIGVIGAALYYGLPYINQKVLVPIEKNSSEIGIVKSEVKALQTQLDKTNNRVDTLEKSIEAHTTSLNKLDEIQTKIESEIQASQNDTLLQLEYEVKYTRALDMMGRARLYLAQSNFGLAREDVKSARDLLSELNNEKEEQVRDQAIARLDLVLGNLPAFPVVASGDLEIAWQILASTGTHSTATAAPMVANTPTNEPTPELTPTPIP